MGDVLQPDPHRPLLSCIVTRHGTASRGISVDHTPMTSRVRSWNGTRLPVMPTPETAIPSTSRPTFAASSRVRVRAATRTATS